MAKALLAFAALGWFAAAGQTTACAETSIETFRTLCLTNGPNPAAIAAAASGLGYKSVPAEEAEKAGYRYGHMQAFSLPGDDKRAMLILGVDEVRGLETDTCVFTYGVDATEDPVASMEKLLQVGPPLDLPPRKAFLFTDDGGDLQRATISGDLPTMAAQAQGKLRLAFAARSEGGAVLQVLALVPKSN